MIKTSISLPSAEYIELLGTAMCCFTSNNGFIIENIINTDNSYDWFSLTDLESGKLIKRINKTITMKSNSTLIEDSFTEIVDMRNRIIHSFRITSENGEQVLATKTKIEDGNVQFEITKAYLIDFLHKNEELSNLLYEYRDTYCRGINKCVW